jgi:hypothetical protein
LLKLCFAVSLISPELLPAGLDLHLIVSIPDSRYPGSDGCPWPLPGRSTNSSSVFTGIVSPVSMHDVIQQVVEPTYQGRAQGSSVGHSWRPWHLDLLVHQRLYTPEDAWPLRASDSSDLAWIRLGAGKMTLWNLVNPMRPESVFRVMTETFAYLRRPLPRKGIDGVSIELAELCGLHELSTQETNPYFSVAHGLSRLLEAPKGAASQGAVILVSRHMHNEFGALLENKDSVALLLLSLWYTRARGSKW